MITIKYVIIKWLNYFDEQPTYLSNSSRILLSKIENNLKIGNTLNIGQVITDLVSICARSSQFNECAEACLNGGYIYFRMQKADESIKLLRKAVSEYQNHLHNQTVARWALGYVLYFLADERDDAIIQWNNCVETYRHLEQTHRFENDRIEWYRAVIPTMEESIRIAAT
jgi:tetratricopeptide (TPR) repeat protein